MIAAEKKAKAEILAEVLKSKSLRQAYFKHNFYSWCAYYFSNVFRTQSAPWQPSYAEDLMFRQKFRHLLVIGHRDSAKTSLAKLKAIHTICYHEKWFMAIVSADKKTAEGHVFGIALQLQTNRKLIDDYGQLFYEDGLEKKKSTQKSKSKMITSNGILVEAFSTDTPLRGKQHITENQAVYRVDWVLCDDFETERTSTSRARTETIIAFLSDIPNSTTVNANIIYCCNKISNDGSVAYLESVAEDNDNWKVIQIDLIKDGKITWPDRFVWTIEDAKFVNSERPDEETWVKSIEQLRKDCGSTMKFNQEYLNIPMSSENEVIKREWIDENYYHVFNRNKPHKIFIILDPQSGESKKADEYALTVGAVYTEDARHVYILEQIAGRGSVAKQAALLIGKTQEYGIYVQKAGVEVILNQTAVWQTIQSWFGRQLSLEKYGVADDSNRNLPISKVAPTGGTGKAMKKEDRLMRIEGKFERGEIHLRPDMLKLREQLLYFGQTDHDDRADSLIYVVEQVNSSWTSKTDSKYNKPRKEDAAYSARFLKEKF